MLETEKGSIEMLNRKKEEISYCFTFEPGEERICHGASGRKLRQVCVWCPNWIRFIKANMEENKHEKSV